MLTKIIDNERAYGKDGDGRDPIWLTKYERAKSMTRNAAKFIRYKNIKKDYEEDTGGGSRAESLPRGRSRRSRRSVDPTPGKKAVGEPHISKSSSRNNDGKNISRYCSDSISQERRWKSGRQRPRISSSEEETKSEG